MRAKFTQEQFEVMLAALANPRPQPFRIVYTFHGDAWTTTSTTSAGVGSWF